MPLTDVAVRNAKPGPKVVTLSDAGGLQLRIIPSGGKSWRLAYRFGGAQKTIILGRYPAMSLREARAAREEAKALLARGIDPGARRDEEAAASAAEAVTFGEVADEFLAKVQAEGRAVSTIDKLTWGLSLVRGDLGAIPVASIRAADILAAVRTIESRGRHETASRVRETVGRVLRYAVATGRAESDPTSALRGALITPTTTSRAAVTNPKSFGALLRSIWGFGGQPETTAALKLCALLACRPGELRLSEWGEFDLKGATWTVPAGRMKMRRPHVAPLSKQVIEILGELREVARPSALVLPGTRSAARPISDGTLNAALRRLGYGPNEATAHGFRASFSTICNESGLWHPDAIERHLAHLEGNRVRAAYARGAHWEERVRLAQWWADRCDGLRREG